MFYSNSRAAFDPFDILCPSINTRVGISGNVWVRNAVDCDADADADDADDGISVVSYRINGCEKYENK